jgi:hypothetical protein
MSARDVLNAAWRQVSTMADFGESPIWRAALPSPLTEVSISAEPVPDTIKMRIAEFRRSSVWNRETRQPEGAIVEGRIVDETDWEPLQDLPRYLVVGH